MKTMVLIFALILALTAGNATMAQGSAGGLVKNGGFEDGVQGALPAGCGIEKENGAAGTVAIDNSQSHSGKQSVLVNMTSASGYLHPSLNATLKPGCYILRVWAKAEPEQSFQMQIYDSRAWSQNKPAALQLEGKGILTKECRANSREWSKFEVDVDVTEEFPASIQIGLTKPGKLWLDDVEIVPSGKTLQEKPAAVRIKQSEQNLEIQNSRIALNIAKGNPGTVLSYMQGDRLCNAVSLNAFQQGNAASASSFKVVKDTPELAVVEVVYSFAAGQDVTVTYSVKNGFEYVEAESDFAQGKAAILTAMKSEVLVLPDFLADSMVFYPESAPAAAMNIPADNHLLVNLIDNGGAMLALLWDSPKMSITETKKGNLFESAALSAGAKTRFWIGVLAVKGIWYKAVEKLNSGSFTALNWTPPFPAEWKLATFLDKGFHVDTPTCESWLLIPKGTSGHIGNGVGFINLSAWQAWSSDLGGFVYPCYLQDNKAFAKYPMLQLGKNSVFNAAPALIYALTGTGKTPAGITMPKNALRKLLPQALNNRLEAMNSPRNHYPATCGTTEKVEKIFYRSESAGEKKQIQDAFVQMNLFVQAIRGRIEDYAAWQLKMVKMLEEQKRINPRLDPLINELEKELTQISWYYAKSKDNMKTPPYCTALTEKVIALCDAKLSDEEKEEQCKGLGRQIRTIGGSQDGTVAQFRSVVKAVRQDATRKLMTATAPQERELLENVRTETGVMLNSRLGMEGK
ncbi:MAG: hypothetical protein WCV67_01065 [Victivallaceae bacterium]|jgi:hypothetical protein